MNIERIKEELARTYVKIEKLQKKARDLEEQKGQTGHEEQEEDHPELAYAFLVLVNLPEESDESNNRGRQ